MVKAYTRWKSLRKLLHKQCWNVSRKVHTAQRTWPAMRGMTKNDITRKTGPKRHGAWQNMVTHDTLPKIWQHLTKHMMTMMTPVMDDKWHWHWARQNKLGIKLKAALVTTNTEGWLSEVWKVWETGPPHSALASIDLQAERSWRQLGKASQTGLNMCRGWSMANGSSYIY